jgi:hypothetical protein
MKLVLSLFLLVLFVLVFASGVAAQNATDAVIKAEKLRLQLIEAQTKEAALQNRALQLDEDLKPENIERALAGIGSTRPEELREQRRRQLQIEKDNVLAELQRVAKTRTDLEAAVLKADAQAYQQSAQGTGSAQSDQMLKAQYAALPGWLVGVLVGLVSVLVIGALILIIRRL